MPRIVNGRRVVTVAEAAEIALCTRRTIYNWIEADRVEVVRSASGRPWIYEDSLWQTQTPSRTPISS